MNEVQRIEIDLNLLDGNVGQVEGVPANPRKQSDKAFRQLKKSLKDFPEFLAYREPLVVPHGGKYVVMCGNMRVRALAALGEKSCVCKILPTDPKKIREAIIKDNVEFGEWDDGMLQGDWDVQQLADWGLQLREKKETDKLSDGEFNTIYYQPKPEEITDISNCIDRTLFNKKMDVINNAPLSDEQKEHLKMFAYRFLRIDFERVANYYAFKASEEEKKVIERLRLVLVDNGGGADEATNGFVEDELLKIADVFNKANEDE